MIHELLGSADLLPRERKISINGAALIAKPCPSITSTSPSLTTSSVTSTAAAAAAANSESQNLRCPRCDSSNTKFCYYNNYNLTQPRHFCKTCRRYWTKGGALRNVPIGGGCRKNKNANVSSSVGKASAVRMIKTVESEIGRSGITGTFDQDLSVASSPILWGSPQNSQLLALLIASHSTNPNPSSISSAVIAREEGNIMGTRMATESLVANNFMSGRILGSDLHEQPPLGSCSSHLWRNTQYQPQQHTGTLMAELPNDGFQELYQRLRSPFSNSYCVDNDSTLLQNNSLMSSSSFCESAPVNPGSELGYGNPVMSFWSDVPTSHDD